MKILGIWHIPLAGAGLRAGVHPGGAVAPEGGARRLDPQCDGLATYEPPRLMVIGTVRDLTTGSSSSGNKDANSQYYW